MDYMSKSNDIIWLACKLEEKLNSNISINMFGVHNEVLTGKYSSTNCPFFKGIDFNIKYSKNEFLRINVGEIMTYKKYDEKLEALNSIKSSLIEILECEPIVFYNIAIDGKKTPHYDWAFVKQQEYADEFRNGTMFDDGGVALDLVIFEDNIKEKVKTK